MLSTHYYPSPCGVLKLQTDNTAVKGITFCDKIEENSVAQPEIMSKLIKAMDDYFAGNMPDPGLALAPEGTDFQVKVWKELCQIPFGRTLSYQDLAIRLGDEKVIRAAASANGKNPIAILIPCHRVVGKNGKLVGYAGGLSKKKWLLAHENRIANGVMELF
ncbi:methylated-DNA--[protein]-cysteine S-methyltransferase [Marinilongibacter aquaticus]|uniref:methylated-DNA--[protein]-cysteine S-methyltransferase n=1 Tax=Marinilongibacter aquaticus TaxID=2975157 RepID=UPI0021BDEE59|nr:methylated-DNA--[protein]-cysteine S-methyltransferase [Marinilongibacter aquaticus]UBM57756.1 methylated-DNA--[protein]-cysteine S-methyltransferase [Marinilongibacter aquaticus]